ncbi:MAG: DoxX family protein [Chitinophagaceae bacterium]|nr:DoxX family protein [Chitinophagaceae bacterium]
MELSSAINKNASDNQPKWLVIFRIILGLILFWKGISFIHDSSELEAMVQKTGIQMFGNNSQVITFIITYINLLGGLFILCGLFTRWSALVQIPILIGAIVFVNVKAGMRADNYELILSIIVLILLVIFVIKGSGVISADEYFRNYYKAGYESGHTKKFLD